MLSDDFYFTKLLPVSHLSEFYRPVDPSTKNVVILPILNEAHLNCVCRLNRGSEECRYLGEVKGQPFCHKGGKDKEIIDREVAEFFVRAQRACRNPCDFDLPLGDHCYGLYEGSKPSSTVFK